MSYVRLVKCYVKLFLNLYLINAILETNKNLFLCENEFKMAAKEKPTKPIKVTHVIFDLDGVIIGKYVLKHF